MFDRRISRVISPGTLIDETFMDPWENNFILSVSPSTSDSVRPDGTQTLGIAWMDLSSGHFTLQSVSSDSLSSAIETIGPREVIVDQSIQRSDPPWMTALLEEKNLVISFYEPPDHPTPDLDQWDNLVDFASKPGKQRQAGESPEFSPVELSAGYFLLQYVRTRLLETLPRLQLPQRRQPQQFMYIDKATLRALEVKTTLRDNAFKGSLLHSVRKTVTKSGTRLLTQRLMSPSMDLAEINRRLDLVSEMVGRASMREKLINLLRQMADLPRVVQKFAFGRGDADDLIDLARSIRVSAQICDTLESHTESGDGDQHFSPSEGQTLLDLGNRIDLDGPEKLALKILDSIDEEMLAQRNMAENNAASELIEFAEGVLADSGAALGGEGRIQRPKGPRETKSRDVEVARLVSRPEMGSSAATLSSEIWIMRHDANPTLRKLHRELTRLHRERDLLEARLQQEMGLSSLALKWTPGLGHICHIRGKDATKATVEHFPDLLAGSRSVGSSRTTRSIALPEWTDLGIRMDEARMRIRAAEQEVFQDLRKHVILNLPTLQSNSAVLDEIDIACGFATLALERNLVRPELTDSNTVHDIQDGRHMTVERGLMLKGRLFTSNDCRVQGDFPPSSKSDSTTTMTTAMTPRILLITGPNMAGKSTFLRQNALISLLAQAGSFVPATAARIGIVDKLFSRVGSADNLFENQSTFMVEMLETAAILRQATPRSLVIMDEVGRGTTPRDGLAIAFATIVHLGIENRCRALFATHFAADLPAALDRSQVGALVKYWCTDVVERDGGKSWGFVHRMREGVSDSSHALKVAKMAGIPDSTLEIASRLLAELDSPA